MRLIFFSPRGVVMVTSLYSSDLLISNAMASPMRSRFLRNLILSFWMLTSLSSAMKLLMMLFFVPSSMILTIIICFLRF